MIQPGIEAQAVSTEAREAGAERRVAHQAEWRRSGYAGEQIGVTRGHLADATEAAIGGCHVRLQHCIHMLARAEIHMADDGGADALACFAALRLSRHRSDESRALRR